LGLPTGNTIIANVGGANYPQTNEFKVDMASKTYDSFPEITPALAMFTRMAKDKAFSFQVELLENNEIPIALSVGAALASGGTSLTVTYGYRACTAGSLIYNPRAGDIARVTTTATTSTVTVTRAEAGTTGVAWLMGDVVYLLPSALSEALDDWGSITSDAATVQRSRVYNYLQLTKMYCKRTYIANDTDMITGQSLGEMSQGQLLMAFKKRMELGLYYGGRASDTASAGTAPATTRMAGGFRHFLTSGTNYKDFGMAFSESAFDDFLDTYLVENYDASNIVLYGGPKLNTKIYQFGKNRGRVSLDKQASGYYGFKVDNYDFNGLLVKLVRCPLLGLSSFASNSGFIIDLNRVMLKVMHDMQMYENIYNAPATTEYIVDGLRMDWSLLLGNENRHAMCVNA
jgi:hypothetical protein